MEEHENSATCKLVYCKEVNSCWKKNQHTQSHHECQPYAMLCAVCTMWSHCSTAIRPRKCRRAHKHNWKHSWKLQHYEPHQFNAHPRACCYHSISALSLRVQLQCTWRRSRVCSGCWLSAQRITTAKKIQQKCSKRIQNLCKRLIMFIMKSN